MEFFPNYQYVVDAAYNRVPKRLPLYEHNVAPEVIEKITDTQFAQLLQGDSSDLKEFFNNFCGFFMDNGYDVVPFECCVGDIMPGSGALGSSLVDPVIKNEEDFNNYPFEDIEEIYFKTYSQRFIALKQSLPAGMKAVGGVGNGVFEIVQDIVGFENLCYIQVDNPELYAQLFRRVGVMLLGIWQRFMKEFSQPYCLLRFGDDLGFGASTMLQEEDIRAHIFPHYKKIVETVHFYKKPFILHSCGSIFGLMEELIADIKINAKHSNEDNIAPFEEWVERYGDRIGNFGGVDLDALIRLNREELEEYIVRVLDNCAGKGGIAFGTGNSIPDYMDPRKYLNMIEIVREYRGDFV